MVTINYVSQCLHSLTVQKHELLNLKYFPCNWNNWLLASLVAQQDRNAGFSVGYDADKEEIVKRKMLLSVPAGLCFFFSGSLLVS